MRIACGQVFTSEFVGGWLGFFTAPEVLLYGLVWENYPNGIWAYRWGDQQFWKSAVGSSTTARTLRTCRTSGRPQVSSGACRP